MAVSFKQVALPALLCLSVAGLLGGMGCSPLTGNEPPLPDSTFTRVLVDLHMTTTRANRFTRPPPAVSDSVFAYHGVREEAFDETLRYYTRHPSAFATLYDTVIDTLNALRNRRWSSPESPNGDATQNRSERR